MSNNFQPQPPSYNEVIDKSAPLPPMGSRAAAYAVPPQEQLNEMKYTNPVPPVPPAFGVHVVPMTTFGRNPVQCTCPHCRSTVITRTEESTGALAWLICILLIVFGCWLGCCLIPFCVTDLQNIRHHCPNCNAFIGEYRPL